MIGFRRAIADLGSTKYSPPESGVPIIKSDTVLPDTPQQARDNLVSVCLELTSAFVVQAMLLITIPLTAIKRGASPGLVGIILSAQHLLLGWIDRSLELITDNGAAALDLKDYGIAEGLPAR